MRGAAGGPPRVHDGDPSSSSCASSLTDSLSLPPHALTHGPVRLDLRLIRPRRADQSAGPPVVSATHATVPRHPIHTVTAPSGAADPAPSAPPRRSAPLSDSSIGRPPSRPRSRPGSDSRSTPCDGPRHGAPHRASGVSAGCSRWPSRVPLRGRPTRAPAPVPRSKTDPPPRPPTETVGALVGDTARAETAPSGGAGTTRSGACTRAGSSPCPPAPQDTDREARRRRETAARVAAHAPSPPTRSTCRIGPCETRAARSRATRIASTSRHTARRCCARRRSCHRSTPGPDPGTRHTQYTAPPGSSRLPSLAILNPRVVGRPIRATPH